MTRKTLKTLLVIFAIIAIITSLALIGCKPKPTIDYKPQLDSLKGVIATQDAIIESMVRDLDSLIELKETVKYVQGKKIIVYKSLTTPNKVAKFAERL